MTPKQLKALMEWVTARAQYEAELREEDPDPQDAYRVDEQRKAAALCEEFGCAMNWNGLPDLPA